jgi:uncharacterized protein (DUF2147 family)
MKKSVVRRTLGLLIASLLAFATSSYFATAGVFADPTGIWLVKDGTTRIRIEKCGPNNSNICGYAVWLKEPRDESGKPRTDSKNPDPKKAGRLLLGHQMILGLKPNSAGKYEGKVYNSENGKFADVTVWAEEPTALSIHGCMLMVLCGSQTWKRVTDIMPGQLAGPVNGPNGPRSD